MSDHGFVDDDYDEDFEEEVPAATGSALSRLRESREQALESLYIDYEVPRISPAVFVRYKPVEMAVVKRLDRVFAKSKDPEKDVQHSAALLADRCIGIFDADSEDSPESWMRFDADLGQLLGVQVKSAADVVRALYLTDGDVIATAGKLGDWSGFNLDEVQERIQGN